MFSQQENNFRKKNLRYAIDDVGGIHRVEPHLESHYHWSGSTKGVILSGQPRALVMPHEVREILIGR